MVCFVTGIHPSRTCRSESPESVRVNACVHRLDLGLYSHPKEFLRNGVRTHVNSKGKSPLSEKKSLWRRIESTTLHQAGQRSQHTTNELIRPFKRLSAVALGCHHDVMFMSLYKVDLQSFVDYSVVHMLRSWKIEKKPNHDDIESNQTPQKDRFVHDTGYQHRTS